MQKNFATFCYVNVISENFFHLQFGENYKKNRKKIFICKYSQTSFVNKNSPQFTDFQQKKYWTLNKILAKMSLLGFIISIDQKFF